MPRKWVTGPEELSSAKLVLFTYLIYACFPQILVAVWCGGVGGAVFDWEVEA